MIENKKENLAENLGKFDKLGLIEKISIDLVHVGTKKTNFFILEMLPTDIKTVMKKTKLSKVPVNVRVNQLEKFGLLRRERRTGKLFSTKLTKLLLRSVDDISSQFIKPGLEEIVPKLIGIINDDN